MTMPDLDLVKSLFLSYIKRGNPSLKYTIPELNQIKKKYVPMDDTLMLKIQFITERLLFFNNTLAFYILLFFYVILHNSY